MCQVAQGDVQVLRVGAGKVVQCMQCKTIGVELGTAYFALEPTEVQGVLGWLRRVLESPVGKAMPTEKQLLKLGESRVMLAMDRLQVLNLLELLELASVQWLHASVMHEPRDLQPMPVH